MNNKQLLNELRFFSDSHKGENRISLEDAVYAVEDLDELSTNIAEFLYYRSGVATGIGVCVDSWTVKEFLVREGITVSKAPLRDTNKRIRRMKKDLEKLGKDPSKYFSKEKVYKPGSGNVKIWHFTLLGILLFFSRIKGHNGLRLCTGLQEAVLAVNNLVVAMSRADRIDEVISLFKENYKKGTFMAESKEIIYSGQARLVKEAFDNLEL